jgi:hypothetical protein
MSDAGFVSTAKNVSYAVDAVRQVPVFYKQLLQAHSHCAALSHQDA